MFSKIIVATALSMALLSGVNAQSNCARNYTVLPGDTCNEISAAQHASSFQLAFVNPQINADCSNLAVGEVLCLGITGQDCTTTAVVNTGDSCPTIEAAARISDATLKANNPNINSDCSNIFPGEVLCTAFQLFNYTETA